MTKLLPVSYFVKWKEYAGEDDDKVTRYVFRRSTLFPYAEWERDIETSLVF